jgi:hypothetical protein
MHTYFIYAHDGINLKRFLLLKRGASVTPVDAADTMVNFQ